MTAANIGGMDLYVGLLLEKAASGRIAQIVALDKSFAYLSWDDGQQTRVARNRFNRTSEWVELVGYEEVRPPGLPRLIRDPSSRKGGYRA